MDAGRSVRASRRNAKVDKVAGLRHGGLSESQIAMKWILEARHSNWNY